ncbi:secretion protein F [Ruminococcaceae bacterium OttesenSCG-928-D13]|nr:secretion protein F [Ruminococcaceae bacterium OttesenSCG-928-D13]
MAIWLFLFGVLLGLGLFFILADLLKLPKVATLRAMISAGRQAKVKTKFTEALMLGWATKLARFIRMDEYKRHRMAGSLNAAGLDMTPELFTAYALVKAGCILLAIVPCLLVLPLLAPFVLILAVLTYFKTMQSADEKLKVKREEIELELPRFVATISQELKASRDVLGIMDNYKRNAGPVFASELDILTADMRSSSYEASLTRFEARINSPLLSDIVRGLIGVLRGDDGAVYFQMLSHDMKQLELQRLKAKAMKIPPKIRVFSFVLLMCFLFMYLAIIIFEIVTSLGNLF